MVNVTSAELRSIISKRLSKKLDITSPGTRKEGVEEVDTHQCHRRDRYSCDSPAGHISTLSPALDLRRAGTRWRSRYLFFPE